MPNRSAAFTATADSDGLRRLIAEAFTVVDLAAEASGGRCPGQLLRFAADVAKHFASELSAEQCQHLAIHLRDDRGFHGVDPEQTPPAELLDHLLFDHLRISGWLQEQPD